MSNNDKSEGTSEEGEEYYPEDVCPKCGETYIERRTADDNDAIVPEEGVVLYIHREEKIEGEDEETWNLTYCPLPEEYDE